MSTKKIVVVIIIIKVPRRVLLTNDSSLLLYNNNTVYINACFGTDVGDTTNINNNVALMTIALPLIRTCVKCMYVHSPLN